MKEGILGLAITIIIIHTIHLIVVFFIANAVGMKITSLFNVIIEASTH